MNDNTRTSLTMTPKRFLGVWLSLLGARELPLSFRATSLVLAQKTLRAALRRSPTPSNTSKPTTQKSHGPTSILTDLLREQFEGGGGYLHSVPRRQRRENLPCYWPLLNELQSRGRSPESCSSPHRGQPPSLQQRGLPDRHPVRPAGPPV